MEDRERAFVCYFPSASVVSIVELKWHEASPARQKYLEQTLKG